MRLPCQILMSRRTRTKMIINDVMLKPKLETDVRDRFIEIQRNSKQYHDKSSKKRLDFYEGQNVVYIEKNGLWKPAKIIKKLDSPRSYNIKNEHNIQLRRNAYHLKNL